MAAFTLLSVVATSFVGTAPTSSPRALTVAPRGNIKAQHYNDYYDDMDGYGPYNDRYYNDRYYNVRTFPPAPSRDAPSYRPLSLSCRAPGRLRGRWPVSYTHLTLPTKRIV